MAADQATIITSLCWISRGFASLQVEEYEPNAEEIRTYKELTKNLGGMNAATGGEADIKTMTAEIEKNLEGLALDKYDQEESDLVFTSELEMLKPKNERDSEMANAADDYEDIEEGSSESVDSFGDGETGGQRNRNRDKFPEALEDSEEEKEDYTIRKTDSLIVAATAEDEHSNLEVYVYDHKSSDLYVHHEIILSSYPLCIEWLNNFRGHSVNYVIVGSFLPQIEIWDINREDCEPLYTLGGADEQVQKKKKKVLKLKKDDDGLSSETSHTDAVMSLSLNPFQSEYLASGSADTTVKIWDIDELSCKANLTNLHKNKVQLVRWNLFNEQLLLTGGYDRVINVCDIRERPLGESAIKYRLKKDAKDIETGQWHPFSEHNFVISTESGTVFGYDTRNATAPIFEFSAHSKACSSVSFSPHIPNMMATCSTDEYIKIWDIAANNGTEPKLIGAKKTTMGELFTLSFYRDIPWVLAAGGSKGEVAVWDSEENESISKHFTPFLDKTRIPEAHIDDSEEEDKNSGGEEEVDSDQEEKKKAKKKELRDKAVANKERKKQKAKQIEKLNKIQEGIQKIKQMKK